MKEDRIKSQVIKTDDFFVENRQVKKQRTVEIADALPEKFMRTAFKANRSEKQRNERLAKRAAKKAKKNSGL